MLLVIDIGNTNIVLGVYEDDELLYDWRISTSKGSTMDEYGLLFQQLFNHHGLDINDICDIIISSVVPALIYTLTTMSNRYFNIDPIVVDADTDTGLKIKYDNPQEIGADRIVNAVGAYSKYGGPLILVDIGTAITFCCISKEGEYLGGAIAPGIEISANALFTRTAKLPKVKIMKPDSIIAKNTESSIQAGLIYGYVGLIDHIITKMKEEMKDQGKVQVIATGGFSSLITSESQHIKTIDKFLTLEGLRIISNRVKSNC